MSDIIPLKTGATMTVADLRSYFEGVFQAERSGEPYPVDLDDVWAFAFTRRDNARAAIVDDPTYLEGKDYVFLKVQENNTGRPMVVMKLSTDATEDIFMQRSKAIRDHYKECRRIVWNLAHAVASNVQTPHLRRAFRNARNIPNGHFCILTEVFTRLMGPMELDGYVVPKDLLPDGSVGRMWANYLRKEKGIEPNDFGTYVHEFEDGRVCEPKLYPLSLLSEFVTWFQDNWMARNCVRYFGERDKAALPHIPKALLPPEDRGENRAAS